ncbi:MAG: histidinol phosphate phosphatase [Marinibacterium sp.]|nr:histidinol phosphate phosphatase [Marinibacterium sp.]
MAELDELLTAALDLADAGGAVAREAWRGDLAVRYKPDGSSLTQADLDIEALWRDRISARYPTHAILGEEYGDQGGDSAYTWVLDPIDGTRQFGTGLLDFASLIALCRDGEPVIGVIDLPMIGLRFSAALGMGTWFDGRQVRAAPCTDLNTARIGLANHDSFPGASGAVYDALRGQGRLRAFDGGSPAYGSLARGLLDVCVNGLDLEAFDICALCPVVTEAGGIITDWQGGALTLDSAGGIVASANAALHDQVLEAINAA